MRSKNIDENDLKLQWNGASIIEPPLRCSLSIHDVDGFQVGRHVGLEAEHLAVERKFAIERTPDVLRLPEAVLLPCAPPTQRLSLCPFQ